VGKKKLTAGGWRLGGSGSKLTRDCGRAKEKTAAKTKPGGGAAERRDVKAKG
jgi:hypothetical protein